jgi:hypothetical protein
MVKRAGSVIVFATLVLAGRALAAWPDWVDAPADPLHLYAPPPLPVAPNPLAIGSSSATPAPINPLAINPLLAIQPGISADQLQAADGQLPSGTAQSQSNPEPIFADDVNDDNSVYSVPPPPRAEEGVNAGGVHLELNADYANRYVYRGVDHDKVAAHGNSLNLLLDGKLTFDLGKYPHPFVGLFTNIYDSDPISRFQEIRPFFGFDWNLRPFLIEVGHTSYIYPERETLNTSEIYAKLTIDDSFFFHTDHPVLSPYIYGAYDYQQNNGWYLEAGLKHDFYIGETGLVITASADVGYVSEFRQQFIFTQATGGNGFQHAEAGLSGRYSLNNFFNIPMRYGEFDLQGFAFYTHKLSNSVQADNILWGGGGIGFKY